MQQEHCVSCFMQLDIGQSITMVAAELNCFNMSTNVTKCKQTNAFCEVHENVMTNELGGGRYNE